MILAFADDFTGAAELGGIGLRYGLDTEVQIDCLNEEAHDLLIIDSNTRCLSEDEAEQKIKSLAEKIKNVKFDWIFKKTDSVLRGHVLNELRSLIGPFEKQHVLLIPANPEIGRTISGGIYFVNGIPLHQTELSRDPNFPRTVSNVINLLGKKQQMDIQVLKHSDNAEIRNITIGDVTSADDLNAWTARLGSDIMPAGGSEFFTAILESKGFSTMTTEVEPLAKERSKSLLVCGSTSQQNLIFMESLKCVCRIPCTVSDLSENCVKKWLDDILNSYEVSNFVVVVLDQKDIGLPKYASLLTNILALLTKEIVQKIPIRELIIEGGDTASAIIRKLGWRRLIPKVEWGLGVVTMHILENPNILLTTKPGSYIWPETLSNIWTNE